MFLTYSVVKSLAPNQYLVNHPLYSHYLLAKKANYQMVQAQGGWTSFEGLDRERTALNCLKALDSPYFPRLHEVIEKDKSFLLIQDAPLDEINRSVLSELEKYRIIEQLIKIVSLLEGIGLVHSQISPDSVRYSQGQVQLINFEDSYFSSEQIDRKRVILMIIWLMSDFSWQELSFRRLKQYLKEIAPSFQWRQFFYLYYLGEIEKIPSLRDMFLKSRIAQENNICKLKTIIFLIFDKTTALSFIVFFFILIILSWLFQISFISGLTILLLSFFLFLGLSYFLKN